MSEVLIIVGVSQLEQRINDPLESKEPAEMMVDAVNKAAEDAHCRALMSESTQSESFEEYGHMRIQENS